MFAKVLGLGVALTAAVVLMSASGASAKVRSGAVVDVSTRAAVVHYLRSIDFDPRGVVIERGVRNYAGADCPGAGWTCTTTTHPVVQIAAAGGSNTFHCSSARCAVVQIAGEQASGPNKASCSKTTGHAQSCTILQPSSSVDNLAVAYEKISPYAGTAVVKAAKITITQTATADVTITQTATGSASNEACVYQDVHLDRSDPITPSRNKVIVKQSAVQTVTITQDAADGTNSADESAGPGADPLCTGSSMTQSQTLGSTVHAPVVVQKQDFHVAAPMTFVLRQNEGTDFGTALGQNFADVDQSGTQTAVGVNAAGAVTQKQGLVLWATINQDGRDVSTILGTQTTDQCERYATSGTPDCSTTGATPPVTVTQAQTNAVHKGDGPSTQTGNAGDVFTVNQSSRQQNGQGAGSHQSSSLQGDCSTTGNCTVTQNTEVNGQQSPPNIQSGQNVNTTTACTASTCGSHNAVPITVNTPGPGGPIDTFDLFSGHLMNSFVPDGAADGNGRGVAVGGNELFYTELHHLFGPSDAIHVTVFNNGVGGSDIRTIPNPDPQHGIQDLDYANGSLYVMSGYPNVTPSVRKLDPANGNVIGGPIALAGTDTLRDGFVVLPNGNFLVNDSGGSCSYAEYSHVTGQLTGTAFIVPGNTCTGVATDGVSLYFAVNYNSVVETGLDGTFVSGKPIAASRYAKDVSLP